MISGEQERFRYRILLFCDRSPDLVTNPRGSRFAGEDWVLI
jgi:hypothetical protein